VGRKGGLDAVAKKKKIPSLPRIKLRSSTCSLVSMQAQAELPQLQSKGYDARYKTCHTFMSAPFGAPHSNKGGFEGRVMVVS
jgi:hypothetical protein